MKINLKKGYIKLNTILINILIFFLIFPIYFRGIKTIENIIIYAFSITIIILNIKKILPIIKQKRFFIILSVYILILAVSIIIPVSYQTNDFGYFKKIINTIFLTFVRYLAIFFVYNKTMKKEMNLIIFFKYFITACMVLVCSTIIFMAFPSLREFWVSIIHVGSDRELISINLTHYVSRFSLVGFSGFTYSYCMTLSLLFTMYLIYKNQIKSNIISVVLIIMCFLGTCFYGRIGILINIINFVILLPFFTFKFKYLKKILLFIIILILGLSAIFHYREKNEVLYKWTEWSFMIIENIFNDRVGDSSTDVLNQQLQYRPSKETLLMGDGRYVNSGGGYYMNIDVGFMRNILFYGIIFTIILYLNVIYIIFNLSKVDKSKIWKIIVMLLFMNMSIFEIKGEIAERGSIIFLFILFIIWSDKKNERKNINYNTSI